MVKRSHTRIGHAEVGRSYGIDLSYASGRHWLNIVWRPGNVLWMVEEVEEVGAQLDLARLSKVKILEDRKVDIVDARQLQRVASGVCYSAKPGSNIFRIGIVCEIADNLAGGIS